MCSGSVSSPVLGALRIDGSRSLFSGGGKKECINGSRIVKARMEISSTNVTRRTFFTNSYSMTAFSKPLILKYFSVECGAGKGGKTRSVIRNTLYWK